MKYNIKYLFDDKHIDSDILENRVSNLLKEKYGGDGVLVPVSVFCTWFDDKNFTEEDYVDSTTIPHNNSIEHRLPFKADVKVGLLGDADGIRFAQQQIIPELEYEVIRGENTNVLDNFVYRFPYDIGAYITKSLCDKLEITVCPDFLNTLTAHGRGQVLCSPKMTNRLKFRGIDAISIPNLGDGDYEGNIIYGHFFKGIKITQLPYIRLIQVKGGTEMRMYASIDIDFTKFEIFTIG
jgi:hypothetical protein